MLVHYTSLPGCYKPCEKQLQTQLSKAYIPMLIFCPQNQAKTVPESVPDTYSETDSVDKDDDEPITGMSILRMSMEGVDLEKFPAGRRGSIKRLKKDSFSEPLTPKTGPAIHPNLVVESSTSAGGSSCHQCKSRRNCQDLTYCTSNLKKKSKGAQCRKKYCDHCLTKFYKDVISLPDGPDWKCPSCRGLCCCAACRRRDKLNDPSLKSPSSSPSPLSFPRNSPLAMHPRRSPQTLHLAQRSPFTSPISLGFDNDHPHLMVLAQDPTGATPPLDSSSPHISGEAVPFYLVPSHSPLLGGNGTPAKGGLAAPLPPNTPPVYSLKQIASRASKKQNMNGSEAAEGQQNRSIPATGLSYLLSSQSIAAASHRAPIRSAALFSALTMHPNVQKAVQALLAHGEKQPEPPSEWLVIESIADVLQSSLSDRKLPTAAGAVAALDRTISAAAAKQNQNVKVEQKDAMAAPSTPAKLEKKDNATDAVLTPPSSSENGTKGGDFTPSSDGKATRKSPPSSASPGGFGVPKSRPAPKNGLTPTQIVEPLANHKKVETAKKQDTHVTKKRPRDETDDIDADTGSEDAAEAAANVLSALT